MESKPIQSPINACLGKTFSQKAITVSVLTLSTAAIALSSFALLQGYLPLIGSVLPMHAWVILGSATAADAFMIALCCYRMYRANEQKKFQEAVKHLWTVTVDFNCQVFQSGLNLFINRGGDITTVCNSKGENILHVLLNIELDAESKIIEMKNKLTCLLERINNYPSSLTKHFLNTIVDGRSPLLKIIICIAKGLSANQELLADIAETLVEAGANLHQQLPDGKTPLQYAFILDNNVKKSLKGRWPRIASELRSYRQPATTSR